MDVEGVCRRLFGPRRRASSDIRNYTIERMALDRLAAQERDRVRERQHVRGEAHPLLHLKQNDEDDPSRTMSIPPPQQQCCIVSIVYVVLYY